MPSPFQVYQIYHAIKLHFTQEKYNAFQYEFKTNVTYAAFEARKDKNFFYKVARKYTTEKAVVGYFVSNIIRDPESIWIGDCEESYYHQWKKRTEGLSYFFEENCRTLKTKIEEPAELFQGNPPMIVNEYLGGRINLETLTIFNSFSNVVDRMEENLLIDGIKSLVQNYRPFLKYDAKEKAEVARKILNMAQQKP